MSRTIATLHQSVVEMPIASETGPTSAKPAGRKTTEPIQSYELTRESRSGGICVCIVVSQSVPKTPIATPATRAPTATAAAGAVTASRASGGAITMFDQAQTSSGLGGRQRSATPPPATCPSAKPARISDHAAAPP